MIRRLITLLFLIVLSLKMTAQSPQWSAAGMPYSAVDIRCIYDDTISNLLYVSGTILASPTTTMANERICKYDGSTWTSVGGVIGGQVMSMVKYNGDLIIAGAFYSINSVPFFSIARFDGVNWYTMGNFDVEVTKLKVINSDLYAMGYFNSVDGIPAKRIAKWNGSAWSDVYGFSADTTEGHINDVEIYKGNIYVCGNFTNSALGINHLAVYKAGAWQNVGGGIHGTWNDLAKLLTHKNELYLTGVILKPANTGNGIQKWNDTIWTEVGAGVQDYTNSYGSMGTTVIDAVIHNNELYAAGSFGYAGHVPAYCAAKWDGLKWCGLATTGLLSNVTLCVNFYNDTLYLGIGNDTLNGIHTNRLIKYMAGNYTDTCSILFTGIQQLSVDNTLNLYPNPSSNQIKIELSEALTQTTSLQIKNPLGQILKTIPFTKGNKQQEIDISDLPAGFYFVQMQSGNRMISKKFIKQ